MADLIIAQDRYPPFFLWRSHSVSETRTTRDSSGLALVGGGMGVVDLVAVVVVVAVVMVDVGRLCCFLPGYVCLALLEYNSAKPKNIE